MRRLLLAAAVTAAAGAAAALTAAVRRHLELCHGQHEGGLNWLIDLEFRTQVLEGRREPVTLKEVSPR